MSWNVTLGPHPGPELVAAIDEIDITQGDAATPETEEQIALAKKLANIAITSGAVGDFSDGTQIRIGMSGHAAPSHNMNLGSADSLTISLSQASAPESPEPEPEIEDGFTDQGEPMPDPTIHDDAPV